MLITQGEFITTPKIVGNKLEAGMYIKNADNTPVTKTVYLKGYNPATEKFHTFGQTIPNSQAWVGMPMITFTDAHIGTWRMHWDIPDLSTTITSGVPNLVVTKVATSMYLTSDKYSIQKGDTVTFSGKYKASAKLQIMDVTDLLDSKVAETTCDTYGNFKVAVNLDVPEGKRKFEGKSFDLFPDKSGGVYITIYPKQTTDIILPSTSATHHLDFIVKPYSWYSPDSLVNNLITNIGDINGYLINIFTGITDYQYINTELLSNEPNGMVTIRIKLKQTSIITMIAPALVTAIGAILIWLFAIVLAVGVITGWKFTLAGAISQLDGKEYSKEEVVNIVTENVLSHQLEECEKNYSDAILIAECKKSAMCGTADGLTDALGLSKSNCATLDINTKIDTCTIQYNIDKDVNKYNTCIDKVKEKTVNTIKENTPKTKSICGLLGLDDQVCTDLKYVGIGVGALIIGYTVYKILPKK